MASGSSGGRGATVAMLAADRGPLSGDRQGVHRVQKRRPLVVAIALIVALTGCIESTLQTAAPTRDVTRDVTHTVRETRGATRESTRVATRAATDTPVSATPMPELSDQGEPDATDVPTISPTLGAVEAERPAHQTGFDEWLAAQGHFSGWQKGGTRLSANGELVLDLTRAVSEMDPNAAGTYYGGNFYTGGTYWVGEATGPAIPVDFDFDELIPSWNAVTPAGTWVEVLVRVERNGRWTTWYNLGIWASGSETIRRQSVPSQGDEDGHVAIDTLVISAENGAVHAYQLRMRLFSVGRETTPSVRYLSAAYSTTPRKTSDPSAGNPAHWGTLLAVPECSQMVYPDGGDVWCSPTSISMVASYWEGGAGPCEPGVRAAAAGTYDWVYGGTGNWPFNTAYAATLGFHGSVRRFSSLEEIEAWVARGVPVVISFAWGNGQLTGAALPSSSGHLAVVVGFDDQGNPIVNDPAAESDEFVQRTYLRSELEPLWLGSTGGTVYVIKP